MITFGGAATIKAPFWIEDWRLALRRPMAKSNGSLPIEDLQPRAAR